jgi:hypothetical protein
MTTARIIAELVKRGEEALANELLSLASNEPDIWIESRGPTTAEVVCYSKLGLGAGSIPIADVVKTAALTENLLKGASSVLKKQWKVGPLSEVLLDKTLQVRGAFSLNLPDESSLDDAVSALKLSSAGKYVRNR